MNTVLEGRTSYVPTVDVTKLCFKDATSYPLLTDEEEKECFRKYSMLVMAKEQLEELSSLSEDDLTAMHRLIAEGERAKEVLLNCNQRLVISIARGFQGRGLDLLDLIQEGNMGLLKAIEKFDASLGNKFSTYATYWIKQAISRAMLNNGRTIRVPIHMLELKSKYTKAVQGFSQAGRYRWKRCYGAILFNTSFAVCGFYSRGNNRWNLRQGYSKCRLSLSAI